jgi:NAD+ kinase
VTASSSPRRVLVLTHTGRAEARDVARACIRSLTSHGVVVRLLVDEAADLGMAADPSDPLVETTSQDDAPAEGCELVLVIGGDGSILRAAELAHGTGTPLLGVNLGHVGFLAEAEQDDIESTISAIVGRRYTAEDRLALDVQVLHGKEVLFQTFALNEASVEKASAVAVGV